MILSYERVFCYLLTVQKGGKVTGLFGRVETLYLLPWSFKSGVSHQLSCCQCGYNRDSVCFFNDGKVISLDLGYLYIFCSATRGKNSRGQNID